VGEILVLLVSFFGLELIDHTVSFYIMIISTSDHFQEGNICVLWFHLRWSKSIFNNELFKQLCWVVFQIFLLFHYFSSDFLTKTVLKFWTRLGLCLAASFLTALMASLDAGLGVLQLNNTMGVVEGVF
jgi:hypothetical protein